jgi:single-strand DNA-binding protein
MAGYEQTMIIGNVGRDPETRNLNSGEMVTSFTVAVSRTWRDRATNQQKESTNWYNVSLWGDRWQGVLPYIRKGKQLMVIGTVSARPYTGQDGTAKATLELRADTVHLLGTRSDTSEPSGGDMGTYHPNPQNSGPQSNEDIPF